MLSTHFSKFTEALNSLTEQIEYFKVRFPTPQQTPVETAEYIQIVTAAKLALISGQRFYVPNSSQVIDTFEEVRLPYDCIALLDEVDILGNILDKNTKIDTTWKISIGFSSQSIVNQHLGCRVDPNPYTFGVLSIVESYGLIDELKWACTPGVVICKVNSKDIQMGAIPLVCSQGLVYKNSDKFAIEREFQPDAYSIANLCTMLTLHNVSSRTVSPPDALQKKRIRRGNQPLFSYKVLVVDGEQWHDRGESVPGTGSVRSHMRRGHIRHLHNSEKRVWVRSTLVHGKSPGFINKDYKLTS